MSAPVEETSTRRNKDALVTRSVVKVVVPSPDASSTAGQLAVDVQALVPVSGLVVARQETLGAEGVVLLDVSLGLERLLAETLLDGLRGSGRAGWDDGRRVVEEL